MNGIFHLDLNKVVEMFEDVDSSITLQTQGGVETLFLYEYSGVVELSKVPRKSGGHFHSLSVFPKEGGTVKYSDINGDGGLCEVFEECMRLTREREDV